MSVNPSSTHVVEAGVRSTVVASMPPHMHPIHPAMPHRTPPLPHSHQIDGICLDCGVVLCCVVLFV